jgi:hypothetical protein
MLAAKPKAATAVNIPPKIQLPSASNQTPATITSAKPTGQSTTGGS